MGANLASIAVARIARVASEAKPAETMTIASVVFASRAHVRMRHVAMARKMAEKPMWIAAGRAIVVQTGRRATLVWIAKALCAS